MPNFRPLPGRPTINGQLSYQHFVLDIRGSNIPKKHIKGLLGKLKQKESLRRSQIGAKHLVVAGKHGNKSFRSLQTQNFNPLMQNR